MSMNSGMQDDATPRLTASLEALNERIARLAMGLNVDFENAQTLADLLGQHAATPVPVERRKMAPAGDTPMLTNAERRVAHLKEELRALVVLRYRLESSSLQSNGLQATRELLELAHQHLLEQGFKPGADGWQAPDW